MEVAYMGDFATLQLQWLLGQHFIWCCTWSCSDSVTAHDLYHYLAFIITVTVTVTVTEVFILRFLLKDRKRIVSAKCGCVCMELLDTPGVHGNW